MSKKKKKKTVADITEELVGKPVRNRLVNFILTGRWK